MVSHVHRLIQGLASCMLLELRNDGDLLHLVKIMMDKRELVLTKVTQVEGHTTNEMVV